MQLNQSPIIEVNTHGMRVTDALDAVESAVNKAGSGVYEIRVIHGYNRGTSIRTAVWDQYQDGSHSRIKKVQNGANPGITRLVLKNMF